LPNGSPSSTELLVKTLTWATTHVTLSDTSHLFRQTNISIFPASPYTNCQILLLSFSAVAPGEKRHGETNKRKMWMEGSGGQW
jgi:hypothetical protein